LLISVLLCSGSHAQIRVIRGTVLDSGSHAPLQNVSIMEFHKTKGTLSNTSGHFKISVDSGTRQLVFTATGYHPYYLSLSDTLLHEQMIMLSKSFTILSQVVVNARKGRYRNKGNPAVELIRKVISNKTRNGPEAADYTSYREYEKARILFDKPPRMISNNFITKKFHFVFENIDSTMIPGKKLFPVYMEETFSQNYFRKHPEKKKKRVLTRKTTDLGEYLDMKAISEVLNRLYEDVNIYDNSVSAFTMQFLSPIADLGPTFYMYFIQDTIVENGVKLVRLNFAPRNPEDLLFKGTLFITLDGNYAVKNLTLELSKHINLNYVRYFEIDQQFDKGPGEHYYLSHSEITAFFSPLPKAPAVYGQRTIDIKDPNDSVIDEQVMQGKPVDSTLISSSQQDSFWQAERTVPLSVHEAKTYENNDSLVKMRSYKRIMDIITLLTAGYKSMGKFEAGPVGSFYSFNSIEGKRLQFGMRSKPTLSSRYFMDGYAAYGFGDQLWKYYFSGTYSINHQSIYSFPFHYIQASYMYDTRVLGQEDIFSQGNSFLGSFNRGLNNSWLYNHIFRLSYVHETESHFSYTIGMKYWVQTPAGTLHYVFKQPGATLDTMKQITTSELSVSKRWAPHEQFYQGKATRRDIINKYPVITFQYSKGIAGLFGGQYNYDAFNINFFKRFYIAPIGFSDVGISAGYRAGVLPYPLLIIHPANQSYFYSFGSYNLMNTGEFLSDRFASIHIDHYFNGFFLNKIPLIKKLRLREVVECKMLLGGLRDENNPSMNPSQMQFPTENGSTFSYVLGNQPYFEAGIGIYNIFSFIRVDLIKRFTYLNHSNISSMGLRFSTNINF
jgi:hypothetical protein